MDSLILFGKQSAKDESVLNYCLKSIFKYVDYDKIYVIGEKPGNENVIHIPFVENPNMIFLNKNIYDKILYACGDNSISDPFLLVYDDYIFLKPYEYKTYHSGILTTQGFTENQFFYYTLQNTIKVLGKVNRFAVHCPLVIYKKLFKNIDVDWKIHHGYCVKTLYCNVNDIQGEYHKDFKLRNQDSKEVMYEFIKDEPLFSLPQSMNGNIREVLSELFD